MDFQLLFNIAIAVIGGVGGWMLNKLTDKLERLQNADDMLKDKIQEVHILVAGNYVRTEALDKFSEAIFKKLDKIENRLYDLSEKGANGG